MLGQNIQYEYEPCEGDTIEIITVHDEGIQSVLEQEGKKCVATVQKDVKVRCLPHSFFSTSPSPIHFFSS